MRTILFIILGIIFLPVILPIVLLVYAIDAIAFNSVYKTSEIGEDEYIPYYRSKNSCDNEFYDYTGF